MNDGIRMSLNIENISGNIKRYLSMAKINYKLEILDVSLSNIIIDTKQIFRRSNLYKIQMEEKAL